MISPAVDGPFTATEIEPSGVCEIADDAQILLGRVPYIEIYHVLTGRLHLAIEGASTITLERGGIAAVPPGLERSLAGSAAPSHILSAGTIRSVRYGRLPLFDAADGLPGAVRIVCGRIDADMTTPIAAALGGVPLIRAACAAMLRDIDKPGPQSRALSGGLMKTCLVLLFRHHVLRHGTSGLPGALSRPWLAEVVSLIRDAPEAPYTVASLAHVAGRSRTTFAKDFAERIGATPMEFVMQARLTRAHDLLVSGDDPVGQIASRSGFASRSHFSRLFKDVYGMGPSAYRRQHQAAVEPNCCSCAP